MRIAYQGEPGAFSEAAAHRVAADAQLLPCRSFEEVFDAVEAGPAGYGVVPIENSIGGSIHRNYDLLLAHEIPIVAEVEMPVASSIQDYDDNITRFLVIGRRPLQHAVPDKTSIVFSVPNEPGSLFKALSVFALRGVDLTKLESRPIPGRPWEYLFYVDLAAARGELTCARALSHLAEFAPMLRTLGSYASWKTHEGWLPDPFEVLS